jgi:DNA-binding transcriptional MocR family regulator
MGYGSSAGLSRLRAGIAALTGVQSEEVITTQGTALGLFILAFELCRPGDEAVIATPCFPPSRDSVLAQESPCANAASALIEATS